MAARMIIARAGARSAITAACRGTLACPTPLAAPFTPARLTLVRTRAERASDRAAHAAEEFGDRAKDSAAGLQQSAKDTARSASEAVGEWSNDAKRAARNTTQDVKDAARDAKRTIANKADEVSHRGEEAWDATACEARSNVEFFEEKSSNVLDDTKEKLGEAKDWVNDDLQSGKEAVQHAAETVKESATEIKDKAMGNK